MKTDREQYLFEECSVPEAIFRLALPTVAGQIILVIYNMADTFFVGLTGNDSMLGAVTICMPAFMFLSAISNLFGVGGASAISRALGAGLPERAGRVSAFSFWGCLCMTALYSLAAYLLADPFIDLLGGTSSLMHFYAREYMLCTVAAGGLATASALLFGHLVRSEGRAMLASIGVAVGGILNIALDPLFMFVLLPPGRETLGAALATALSNFCSLLYFIAVLIRIRRKSCLSFAPSRPCLQDAIPYDVLTAGLPACIMTLFENISFAVLDKLMSVHGVGMQAGIGVAKKINMLAHSMVRGISQGALPLIGYNYASGNFPRMKDSIRAANRTAIVLAGICTAGCLAFSEELVGIFFLENSVSARAAADFLRILCIGAPFSACAYTYISFFQAVGEGKRSFFLAILRKGIVDIPLMFLLQELLPLFGIVLATPLADALCCLASILMFRHFICPLDTLTKDP